MTANQGAVINISPDGWLTLVLWRPEIRADDPKAWPGADGTPLSIVAFSRPMSAGLAQIIIGNLRHDVPDFPVTVLD